MKCVNDLIEELQKLPKHLTVVISSDAEGNRLNYYSDLEATRVTEAYRGELEPEFDDDGEVKHSPPNAVIIFPIG